MSYEIIKKCDETYIHLTIRDKDNLDDDIVFSVPITHEYQITDSYIENAASRLIQSKKWDQLELSALRVSAQTEED